MGRTAARFLVGLAVGLCGACTPDLPVPRLTSMSPDWGYNGEETRVTITGEDLYPRVQVSAGDQFEVDRQYRLWLETDPPTELDAVELDSYTSLSAIVPAGLETGLYDLQLLSETQFITDHSTDFFYDRRFFIITKCHQCLLLTTFFLWAR